MVSGVINRHLRQLTDLDRSTAVNWAFALAAWIFILEYSLYLVTDNFADKIIKLGSFTGMLVLLLSQRLEIDKQEKTLIALLGALLLSALLPSIFHWDGPGTVQWLKIAFMSSILGLILLRSHASASQLRLLTSIYVGLAVLFALQAILAFFAVWLDWSSIASTIDIDRRPGQQALSLGPLGLANAIQNPVEGIKILRPQGWFIEPSILGAFLLYPAFASLARYRLSGKIVFRVLAVAIFGAIFLTFSLATYFAVLAGVLFLGLSKLFHRRLARYRVWRYAYPVLILIIFVVSCKSILFGTQKINQINLQAVVDLTEGGKYGGRTDKAPTPLEKFTVSATKMLARDPQGQSGNLFREAYKANAYSAMLHARPFGAGLGSTLGTSELNSANAFLFWAVAGGIPALLVLTVFFWFIFWKFCHPLLISDNVAYRCAAASFIGHAIHNMSYGTWVAPFFLLHLAVVVIAARQLHKAAK